jgi:hypothetical protein
MGKARGGAPARFFEKILPQKRKNSPLSCHPAGIGLS